MKVNLGCGLAYLEGWTNVDADPGVRADIYLDAVEFVRRYGDQVEEIYLGHFLEHVMPSYALSLLRLINEKLPPGATVSAVTPDMRAIFQAYMSGELSNEELNMSYVYSYVQPSHHVWCYDQESLLDLFRRAGFEDVQPITDVSRHPPVFHKEGPDARWQCGVRATATGRPVSPVESEVERLVVTERATDSPPRLAPDTLTDDHLLVHRVQELRRALIREYERRRMVERHLEDLTAKRQPDEGHGQNNGPVAVPEVGGRHPLGERPQEVSEGSSWREKLKTQAKAALPPGSPGRIAALGALHLYREGKRTLRDLKRIAAEAGLAGGSLAYQKWCALHGPDRDHLRAQRIASRDAAQPPTFLVCVLAERAGGELIEATLRSIREQSWEHWAVALCVPESEAAQADRATTPNAAMGSRVAVVAGADQFLALRKAVEDHDRDFVIIVEAGDLLAPDCLFEVARAAWQDPLLDLVYWDDDVIDARGRRHDPLFKPSWSPEMLVGINYLAQSFAIRRARMLVRGSVRDGFGEATLWDLLLRSDLRPDRVARVPRVLTHLRRRLYGLGEPGCRAVQEELRARGLAAKAELTESVVRIRWEHPTWPLVSVVIPTRHNRPLLQRVLAGLRATDYPAFEIRIVDNGGRSQENEEWYRDQLAGLDAEVLWWEETPFNYSRVNNAAAARTRGEVLVFLNDDIELTDPSWLRELVGWATVPDIGLAGMQLTGPDGKIQHGGVILGLGGFADHLFQGMAPDSWSLLGHTGWYRNVLSVTGACVAVRREVFEKVGGFDERFVLCGSDVALGLDLTVGGLRNVCTPFGGVRHLESATRGTDIPRQDFFISYWRYNPWLYGGDPYFSPHLSTASRELRLRRPRERGPLSRVSAVLGRELEIFRQRNDTAESTMLAGICEADDVDVAAVARLHEQNGGRIDVRVINWYIPGIDSPFYGGINTALRIADHLARHHGVQNRFVVWSRPEEEFVRSALMAAFPSLANADITFLDTISGASQELVPPADVSIATLWVTAYAVLHARNDRRKFYLVQDFEPVFYPASTLYALAEESYRLGLYGLCNTENLRRIYVEEYGGKAMSFMPAVDRSVFHPHGRPWRGEDDPVTLFVYARPGHWRNCWELASLALRELKNRLGNRVRIVTAGSWAVDPAAESFVKNLGLLSYQATGELYRHCDVGMALTVSKHPSYLPLELMACGVPVVAFDNPSGYWILENGENSLLARRTVAGLADALERLCVDRPLREKLAANALATIDAHYSSWDHALSGIYDYLCDPESFGR
ncbi:MAG: glycosyltransferase [Acidothermus sp.]|nr:glycosyltransferase [Acidothermus sp.]